MIRVKVEGCWGGKERYFLLTWGNGHWQHLHAEKWNRRTASEALNILEHVYHLDRRSVRFDVH